MTLREDWAEIQARAYAALSRDFDESKHPRVPGGPGGGEFAPGGGGQTPTQKPAKQPAPTPNPDPTQPPSATSSADLSSMLSEKEKDQLRVFGSGEKSWKDKGVYDKLRTSKEFGDTLAKLPRIQGTFYRGMVLKEADASQFAVGKMLTIDKHSFASPKKDYAKAYAQLQLNFIKGGTPILLSVNNAVAGDYRAARQAYGEKATKKLEAVFEAGSKFIISSVRETVISGVKGLNVVAEYR